MKNKKEIFDVIATELCRRVKLTYPPPEGSKYKVDAATWTKVEEDDFREWMKKYLLTIPSFRRMGVRYIKKEIEWFVFQFGWKYKEV